MTSAVSPAGTEPSGHVQGQVPGPVPSPARRGLVRRIAEEEYILIVLLAGFGLIFLLIFPPALIVNDSWLNLMAGREIIENGLPTKDEITAYGAGATWTDQQWLAQVFMYAVYSLGGFALLSIVTCAFVTGAFGIATAAARSLGAGPRAIWVLFLPVLISAAIGWTIRAQMLVLPLYTGLLWLLATQARAPTRRIWLAFPLLIVWANVHGSVVLGALLVVLLGAYELIRRRGAMWPRSLALIILAPLAVLATPYGPVDTARYYHLLLVDPPFAGRVTEWSWPAPSGKLYIVAFYVLLGMTIPLVIRGRRRLTTFDLGVLVITLAGALTAVRGIPWFAFACMVFVPVAIGRRLEAKKQGEPRRGLNVAIATGLAVALLAVAGSLFTHDEAWFEEYWPREPVEAVRGELRPEDRVFAPDRFSDWMLFKIPELRGRLAYDVRFELYDREFYDRLQDYNFEDGRNWKSFADGYRIVVLDEERGKSHLADFLKEPGTRVVYRDDEITVVARRGT